MPFSSANKSNPDHRLYREGILSFAFIYKAFEDAWAAAITPKAPTDPRIKSALQSLYSIPLLRAPQLIKDLEYFFGSSPYSLDRPRTFQRSTYVAHIQRTISDKPHVLIAYAHNYYMALFAGGKVLKYHISHAKNFFPERGQMTAEECRLAGTNLFQFEIEKGKEESLRTSFKAALAALEGSLTAEEKNGSLSSPYSIQRKAC
jgi:heme oxygenase